MASVNIKQEKKYYNKIRSLLEFESLTAEQQDRLNKELEIIHKTKSSKIVYIAYLAAKKLKEDGKKYCLRGNYADLLLFYLLGITKISPYDDRLKYVLPYQVAVGEIELPRKIIEIDINVEPSAMDTVIDYVIDKTNKDSELFIGGETENDGDSQVFKRLYIGFMKKGDNTYNHGFSKYEANPINFIENEIPYIHFFKYYKSERVYGGDNFWDDCLSMHEPRVNYVNGEPTKVLRCQEDIWQLVDKVDLRSNYLKMELFKTIKGGLNYKLDDFDLYLLEEAAGDQWDEIYEDIKNIRYLFPIAHAIEYHEYYI